ncbi:restriction endonuclease subunit S [Gemmiger formicilis]|jgi:type I restriction enzyme S subunit|uniref:restriction endonuclease subunit S n=2 Tax=Gemmiger formicilis TaxID=745368 RepID=UPI00307DCF89
MAVIKRVRLSEIAELVTKGTTPTTLGYEFQDTGVNFLKIECFSEKGDYIQNKATHISEECHEKLKRSQLKEGDILFSIAGVIGRVAIVTRNMLPANINQALAIIRIKKDDIYLPYVKLILTSPLIKKQFERKKQGVAQLNISLKDINDLEIPLPEIGKQIEYANSFKKVEKLIYTRQYQLQKLDELVKARFVELFGDPISNPMNWNKRTLKEVCIKLNDGTHFSPESFSMGDYKYITAKNIKASGFDFSNITYVPEAVHRPIFERCNPEQGDVLYIKDGATTGIAIVNTLKEEFTLLSSVALLKQNRNVINGYFLAALLNNADMYSDIRNNMGGAAITRLTIAKLNAVKVIVPPLDLQNRFAAFVHQVDKSKVAVQKSLDEAQLLFDSLMQQYFG